MSIYKRTENGNWWIQFTGPDGERIQRTAGTKNKKEAQELHDQLKAAAWRINKLGEKPRRTWQEAVIKWLTENEHKRSIETDKVHLRWLDTQLSNMYLDEISKTTLDNIKEAKRSAGVSNATVNRVLSIVRAILNRAKSEWEWIDAVPSVRMLSEPTVQIGRAHV